MDPGPDGAASSMQPAPLDAVLVTEELDRRPSRAPNYPAENAALRELMAIFSGEPETALQKLTEIAMARCGADAAAFSMGVTGAEGEPLLCWQAAAGGFAPYRGACLPPEETPGSFVIAQGATQLFSRPASRYLKLKGRGLEPAEVLIAPFFVEGQAIGALWVARYDADRPFDGEDRRMLEGLAGFASVAWRGRQDRQAVREGEEFLRLVTDRLPVRVAYVDREFRFRFMNDAYERDSGLVRSQVIGRTVIEALGESVFAQVRNNLERAFGGEAHTQEFEVPYPAGHRLSRVTYVPDTDESGHVRGAVVQVLDLTELRRAERAVQQSEERYQTLFDSIDEGFVIVEMVFDAAGKPVDYTFREFNDAFSRHTGIPAEWARNGMSARQAVPGLEDFWFETYGRVALTGEAIRFENESVSMGRWFEVHAFRMGGDGSAMVGILFKDVTLRKRQEAALEEARRRLDETLETADVATYDWNVRADRLTGNDKLARFFGVPNTPEGQPIGLYFEGIHPEDREPTQEAISHSLATGERYETQYRVKGSDGAERWVLARGDATLDAEGQPLRLSGVVLDVTERAEQEEERERLLAELAVEQGRLEALFKMSPSAIAVIRGGDLRFEYANDAYFEIVGRHDILGKPLVEALPEIEGQGFVELLHGVLDTGVPFANPETPVVLQPNLDEPAKTIYVNLLYQAIREVDGSVSGVFVHAVDVTDQVVARREIAAREELFRTVFEQAPDDAILVMDRDRTLTAWNPAAERITGWTAAEAVGQPADIIFTPEDRTSGAPEEETEGAARDGKAVDERWHMRKDGSRLWGSGTMNALHDAVGNVTGYLKVFRDATAHYEEVRTLGFLRRLTETVIDLREPDAIIQSAERMLGEYLGASRVLFAEADAEGMTVNIRHDWTDGVVSIVGIVRVADFGPRAMAELQSGQAHISRDNRLDYAPGEGLEATEAIGVRATVSLPIMKNGRLAAVVAVHQSSPRDWTEDEIGLIRQVADRIMAEIERSRSEAALRASEERFRAAQETTPDPFTIIEAVRNEVGEIVDFRWTFVNAATERLTGESAEELVGALVSERRPGIKHTDLFKSWVHTVATGEPFSKEVSMDYRTGRSYLRLTGVRVGDGLATAFADLTQRQLNEERLEAAISERTAQLQAAVREAEGFNYSISHDLRAPVRAIASTSSILLEDIGPGLDAEYRSLLERQVYNANRLGTLIDELLRLSRYARVAVNRQPLDMTRKALSVAEEVAEGCSVEVQEGMTAQGDPGLVRTVFQNLIGNACKFSPKGGVVKVGKNGEAFFVRDQGVGFDMAYAEKVFLPFERLVTESEFPGTGIGLANVKRIVERHGGRVWAESSPGKGATFYFTLGG